MANPVCEVLLTDAPLVAPSSGGLTETGAIVDFWGVVRRSEGEREISGIEYEAHDAMAEYQLRRVAEAAATRYSLGEVRILHRLGFVRVGEASLLVRVGSRHRAAAFEAAQLVVEELKKRVPIWKHPRFAEMVDTAARGAHSMGQTVPSGAT